MLRYFLPLWLAQSAVHAEVRSLLPEAPAGKAWQQVWNDEFDGTRLDPGKWELPDGKRRDHWWSPKTAFVDGKGHLVLRTEQKDGKFQSPCVRTKGRYEKAFGYFETRCKLPKEQGHWTAFWLYHGSVNKVGDDGRDGTEIDVFEWPYRDGRIEHNLHWDGYSKEHHKSAGHVSRPANVTDGKYHVFALWWSPEQYVFYIDGKEVWRTKAGGVCQAPLYLKWSTEIGEWAGDIRKAKLPDDTLVDYVRVFDLVARE